MDFSNPPEPDQHIRLGLLGQSLGHSLSPIIHQAFFEELGLSGSYEKIEVASEGEVAGKLSQLAREGYTGLNVTIPYKRTVLPSMASLDASAELAGAVNTIKFGHEISGYNTDVSGLAEALSIMDFAGAGFFDNAKNDGDYPKALLLGSGGAARAAVIALSFFGFKQLAILSRNQENARLMLDQLLAAGERATLVHNCQNAVLATFESETDKRIGANVSLVVNATPIGQKDKSVPPSLVQLLNQIVANSVRPVFVDLVYGKEPTPLCQLAQEIGFARVADGTEMLIQQARLAFKIWTGHLPDAGLARNRLKESP